MKNLAPLWLVFLVFNGLAVGQSINQDTDGYSIINVPSTNLNLDITGGVASFNFYTYLRKNKQPLHATESGYMVGGDIKTKVESGLGSIVSADNIAADASLTALVAKKWYRSSRKVDDEKINTLYAEIAALERAYVEKNKAAQKELEIYLSDKSIDLALFKKCLNVFELVDSKKIESRKTELVALSDENSTLTDRKIKKASLLTIIEMIDDAYVKKLAEREEKYAKVQVLKNALERYAVQHIFVRGGLNGTSFDYDLANGASTIKERFTEKNFNGWNVEVGYNLQRMDYHFFGLTYEIKATHNLSGLDELEFSLTTVDPTITGGQFSSTETGSAFVGDFDTFNRHSINFDYVWVIPILDNGENSDIYLSINPYGRHRMYDNSRTIKQNTVFGFGVNAFSSKKQSILGGISVQANDTFGVHAGEGSTIGNRISVGLIAKFAFSGIKFAEK